MKDESDHVIVVGAGPVGVLTALGLAQRGIPVTVIDREPSIIASPRAAVYHWTVLEGLDQLGILRQAEEIGFTKQDYSYLNFKTRDRVAYSMSVLDRITAYPYNVHLGQDRLAGIALAELESIPHASVRFGAVFAGVSQSSDHVDVQVDIDGHTEQLRAGWLVGADGGGSTVRRAMGSSFNGMTWQERFVATNVRHDFAADGFARGNAVADDRFGAIVVKLDDTGGTGLWRYTYSEPLELPEETIPERMEAVFKAVLPPGAEFEVAQFSPYRMHQRAADSMRFGRVLLAGDAAHVTNPTGGLGLTIGIFDSFALTDALGAVITSSADESVLDRYSSERLRVFWDVASPAASENKRFVFNSFDPDRLAVEMNDIRVAAEDPDKLRERLRFTEALRTAALV